MSLNEVERGILGLISDGSDYDLFAYPLITYNMEVFIMVMLAWYTGKLIAYDYIEVVDQDEGHTWIRITAKGLEVLSNDPKELVH